MIERRRDIVFIMASCEEQDGHGRDVLIAQFLTARNPLGDRRLSQFQEARHHGTMVCDLLHTRRKGQKFPLTIHVTTAMAD